MRKQYQIILSLLLSIGSLQAQDLVWQGTSGADFFDEANWVEQGTTNNPAAGAIDAGVDIGFNLMVSDAEITLAETATIQFATGKGLTLDDAEMVFRSLESGSVTLNNVSTLILHSETPLGANAEIQLENNHSWVKLIHADPNETNDQYIAQFKSGGNVLVHDDNAIINQYYYDGALVRLKDLDFTAMTLYDETGRSGESFGVKQFEMTGRAILGAFENKASSFRLERGYQAIVAIYQNGTGTSEAYIASEEALEIDLPAALNNTISFIRVMPWNWVTKKGASKFVDVGNSWTYNWNRNAESLLNMEYAPMSWGSGGASLGAISDYTGKERVTHVLGFNESDNCNGQSGQYNNLCQVPVAVPLHKNLMRTGLRLASPSPREGGPFGWSRDFRDLAVETDVRYDVLGVHWYDWGAGGTGSNPVGTPFADANAIFERFKKYLDDVYAIHGLPIWITEFNANANRDSTVHREFLELALPYLESLDFIERYDYFEPSTEVSSQGDGITYPRFYDTQGNITEFGRFYRDFASTPSIPEATWNGSNMLRDLDQKIELTMEVSADSVAEGESLTLTFATSTTVGAPESFEVSVSLGSEQFTLDNAIVEIPEGGSTGSVKLTAVDDDLEEAVMTGTITLTGLTSGIEWSGSPVDFHIPANDIVQSLQLDGQGFINIYPNPTKGKLFIDTKEKLHAYTIYALDGRQVDSVHTTEPVLDLSALVSSTYLVRVYFANGSSGQALISKE